MTDRLEAGVDVQFCEDVFDVIVDGGRTDVKLIGNRSCAVTLCQTLQDLGLPQCESHIDRRVTGSSVRAISSIRSHKFIQRLFESLPHLTRTDNEKSLIIDAFDELLNEIIEKE